MNTNFIMVIVPYRYGGAWVFDDERVGLVLESFFCGIPEMIDELVRGTPHEDLRTIPPLV